MALWSQESESPAFSPRRTQALRSRVSMATLGALDGAPPRPNITGSEAARRAHAHKERGGGMNAFLGALCRHLALADILSFVC